MLPVVTILGMDIGLALGGAFFTETGLRACQGSAGSRSARSATSTCATMEGVVVFATLCIIIFNLVVDTLYAWWTRGSG